MIFQPFNFLEDLIFFWGGDSPTKIGLGFYEGLLYTSS